jgi:hypothetical protein
MIYNSKEVRPLRDAVVVAAIATGVATAERSIMATNAADNSFNDFFIMFSFIDLKN